MTEGTSGQAAEPPAADEPLWWHAAFPAGATLADLDQFVAAALRAGADTKAVLRSGLLEDGRVAVLACPLPDEGTTTDAAAVRAVTGGRPPAHPALGAAMPRAQG